MHMQKNGMAQAAVGSAESGGHRSFGSPSQTEGQAGFGNCRCCGSRRARCSAAVPVELPDNPLLLLVAASAHHNLPINHSIKQSVTFLVFRTHQGSQ